MTNPDLLVKYGYPVETHTTFSSDGFELVAHRIPHASHRGEKNNSRVNRKPVILAHALLCSSSDWLMNVPEKALGYILADAGFDVWLINSRGNSYSSYHINFDDTDFSYWDFRHVFYSTSPNIIPNLCFSHTPSFHEMGTLDIPAWIDYILNVTGHSTLHFCGHSMGSTEFFITMAERPEYNQKIDTMFALAPALYLTESRYWLLAKLLTPLYGKLINVMGPSPFVPTTFRTWLNILGFGCTMVEPFCDNFFFFVAGYNPSQTNSTQTAVIASHTPDNVSSKTVNHFLQIMRSGKFQKYDYGWRNMDIYGQEHPPEYNLKNVTASVVIFHSENDIFATPNDVRKSCKLLPNLKEINLVKDPLFTHVDFTYAIDADKLIYSRILDSRQLKVILTENQPGEITFRYGGVLGTDLCAELTCCMADLRPVGDGNGEEMSWTNFERVQKILNERKGEAESELQGSSIDFTVSLVVRNPGEPSQYMEGSVQGEMFQELFQEFDEQPLTMKLNLGLVSESQWKKGLVIQEIAYSKTDGFKFTQELDSCWRPSKEHTYNCELTVELMFKPRHYETDNEMDPELIKLNQKFLEDATYADISLITANGTSIPCHKMFLKICSPQFRMMIEGDERLEVQVRRNSIKLGPKSTGAGVMAMLKYVYYRNLEDAKRSPKISFELLAFSRQYGIPSLEAAVKELFLEKPVEWWHNDLEALQDLFCYIRELSGGFEDLKGRAIDFIAVIKKQSHSTKVPRMSWEGLGATRNRSSSQHKLDIIQQHLHSINPSNSDKEENGSRKYDKGQTIKAHQLHQPQPSWGSVSQSNSKPTNAHASQQNLPFAVWKRVTEYSDNASYT
ncbi:Lipase 1 [Orchesella cincta]|uniref:Lipase 1 n=1 Tax=Orchesella cincta TaxID=48709 RepID=A0A1D2MKP8_ORCCI|nr:Lipase 1 [Orchesella cincta]